MNGIASLAWGSLISPSARVEPVGRLGASVMFSRHSGAIQWRHHFVSLVCIYNKAVPLQLFYSLSPLSLVVEYKDDAVRKYSIDLFLSVPERNCFITSFCLSLPPHSTYRPGLHLNVSCPIFSFFHFFFFFCFLPDGLRAREWPTPDVVEW